MITAEVGVSSRGDQYGPDTGNPDDDHEVPALRKVLGDAFGMQVTFVVAELTLVGRISAMAPLAEKAAAGLQQARETLDNLAVKLSNPGSAAGHSR